MSTISDRTIPPCSGLLQKIASVGAYAACFPHSKRKVDFDKYIAYMRRVLGVHGPV